MSIKCIISYLRIFRENILNLFFPSKCLACSAETSNHYTLCPLCWKKLTFITYYRHNKCCKHINEIQLECQDNKSNTNQTNNQQSYSSSRSLLSYHSIAKHLVYQLKYSYNKEIGTFFAKLMLNQFQSIIKTADCIIPVPMHHSKYKTRKYNQSEILAIKIAKKSKIPYSTNVLLKTKNTKSQMLLSKKLRRTNVIDSFAISKHRKNTISNKTIILIDDVFTTGSTANECSKTLIINGAKKVIVLTATKTLLHDKENI